MSEEVRNEKKSKKARKPAKKGGAK